MKSVTRVVQEMVMSCPLPLKVIAAKIGKPYSTLLRELNPYDTGAKLGVETMLDLMRITNNYTPLQYMAEELGCTVASRSAFEPGAGGVAGGHGKAARGEAMPTLPLGAGLALENSRLY